MAEAPLFYSSVTILNRDRHRDLKTTEPPRPFGFAAQSHVVPALAEEFGAAARHLPIVFLPGATQPTSVFLVGLRPGHNEFVSGTGQWTGTYVPAYLRRYPFIIGEVTGAESVVCIDEAAETLSRETGERLFAEDGSQTPLLDEKIRFTTDYFVAAKRSDVLATMLRDFDLLRPITIESKADGSNPGAVVHGLFVVDEAKLAALPDDKFLSLRREGFVGPIFAHLISLGAIEKLSPTRATTRS